MDENGPRNMKAQQLLEIFMRPEFLFSVERMELLLGAIGFDKMIAMPLLGELRDKSIYYNFVIVSGFSWITEAITMSDLSIERLKKFITLEHELFDKIEPFLYAIGLFMVFEGFSSEKYSHVRISFDSLKMTSLLNLYGVY